MKYLSVEEKKTIAAFFVNEFAAAGVVKDMDGYGRETAPCKLSDAVALVEGLIDDKPAEMTAFVSGVYELLAAKFGHVYACWYHDGGPFAGTLFQSGIDEDAAADVSIQMNAMAAGASLEDAAAMYRLGDDEDNYTISFDVYDLGEWAIERLCEEIDSGRYNGDVADLISDLSGKLTV